MIQKVTVSSLGRTMLVSNFPFLLYFPPVDITPFHVAIVLAKFHFLN